MNPTDFSREVAALQPHLHGNVLELPGADNGLLPGTRVLARNAGRGTHDFDSVEDASVDAIVAISVPSPSDWIEEIAQWRRVLKPDAVVALAAQSAAAVHGVRALLDLVGGFANEMTTLQPGASWLLVGNRRAIAEVRNPLGSIGPRLATCAAASDEARAELYFQVGTILLQAGDPDLARACFASLVALEPNSAEGLFGLGMCDGTQGRWQQAHDMLEQAARLDPHNEQVARWRQLAEQQCGNRAPTLVGAR